MTAKELNAAITLQRKIDRLQGRLDDLRQSGGVGGKSDNTPVMGGSGGVCAGQIAAELEQEVLDLKEKLAIEKVIIRRHIDKLGLSDAERKLMVLRYVECRAWRAVSVSMGYVERQVYRIHEAALKMSVDVSPCH